jgi:hypothetical protein
LDASELGWPARQEMSTSAPTSALVRRRTMYLALDQPSQRGWAVPAVDLNADWLDQFTRATPIDPARSDRDSDSRNFNNWIGLPMMKVRVRNTATF